MRIADAATFERRRIKQQREFAKQQRQLIRYKFYSPDGVFVFQKVRKQLDAPPPRNKTFWYEHWVPSFTDGGEWLKGKPPGADALLYGLRDLLLAKASGATIWWTEGEKDAESLLLALDGDDCAVSHHQAAGNSTPEQAEWFRGHNGDVVLLMDLDEDHESGANPGAYDVVKRCRQLLAVGVPQERIGIAAPLVGKDISDHLAAGHSLDELVWVTDHGPLIEKYELGNGFRAAYMGLDEETIELGGMLAEGWRPTVVRRG